MVAPFGAVTPVDEVLPRSHSESLNQEPLEKLPLPASA